MYSAKNKLHIREMVPANEFVFHDYKSVAFSVSPTAPFFPSNSLEDRGIIGVRACRWWQILAVILSRPNQIVIYHGGYWAKIWWTISFASLFCRRQIFVNWGGELTPPTTGGGASKLRHIIKRIAVRRLSAVVFLSESDVVLGRKAHPDIHRHSVIPYFNERHSRRVHRYQARGASERQDTSHVIFQIGNDASEANNHIACLEQFHHLNLKKTFIFPMNYGRKSEGYIVEVLNMARSIMYTEIEVLEDMLSQDGFDEFIDRCDALLVGSKHQRSLYSIYAYLGSGKSVFLPEHSEARHDLVGAGFEIETLESISTMTPDRLLEKVRYFNHKNVMRVQELLGLATIRGEWDLLLRRTLSEGEGAV